MTKSDHDAPRVGGMVAAAGAVTRRRGGRIGDLVEEAATSTDRQVSSWPRLWMVWQAVLT